ncbi:MAG TPA: holo-ACP synthase [Terriglobia bacterium]|nr:holo-ACP synthase [Terriglobia bacterium]
MLYFAPHLGQNSNDMIVGLGVDIAEVERLRQAIERHGERFLERVFTPLEIAYCLAYRNSAERFAARFAAKEAAMKALGTGWRGGVAWRDIEVENAGSGQPGLKLTGRAREICDALGGTRLLLSLTHTDHYALAQVLIEGDSSLRR